VRPAGLIAGSIALALTLIEAGGQRDLADGRPAGQCGASGRALPRGVGAGRGSEPGPGTDGATGGVVGLRADYAQEGDGDEPGKQGHMHVLR
jgi:hypothetical protein